MTMKDMKDQAYGLGIRDALAGRLYRASLDSTLRGMGLASDYEAGWNEGRKRS